MLWRKGVRNNAAGYPRETMSLLHISDRMGFACFVIDGDHRIVEVNDNAMSMQTADREDKDHLIDCLPAVVSKTIIKALVESKRCGFVSGWVNVESYEFLLIAMDLEGDMHLVTVLPSCLYAMMYSKAVCL